MTNLSKNMEKRLMGQGDRLMLVNLGEETKYHPPLALPDYAYNLFFETGEEFVAIEPDYAVNIDKLVEDSKLSPSQEELNFMYNFEGMMALRVQKLHPWPWPFHWFNRHVHQIIFVGSDLKGFAETGHYKIAPVQGQTWKYHLVAADFYTPKQDKNFKFMFLKHEDQYDVLDTYGNRIFEGSKRFAKDGIVFHVVKKHIPFTAMDAGKLGVQLASMTGKYHHVVQQLGEAEHRAQLGMAGFDYATKRLVAVLKSTEEYMRTSHKLKLKGIELDLPDIVAGAELMEGMAMSGLPSETAKRINKPGETYQTLAMTPAGVYIPNEIQPLIEELKAKALTLQVSFKMIQDLGAEDVFMDAHIIKSLQLWWDMGYGPTVQRLVEGLKPKSPKDALEAKYMEIIEKLPAEPITRKTVDAKRRSVKQVLTDLVASDKAVEEAGEAVEP